MANKNQYQALLRAKVKSAVEQARSASAFTHQGVKGTILEILIGSLFRPLLPSYIGVGTGQIIDSYNSAMSPQIDIILYDSSILPPVLFDEKTGIFPVESVLYTIEVKTTLNIGELRIAHESAKNIAKFGYLPGLLDELGNEKNHPIEKIRSVVFALGSSLSGKRLNEAQRYKSIYKEESAHLRAICVAGKEYWYDDGEYWQGFQSEDEYDDILAFIGGVTNTYKEVSRSRHEPLLGNYVVPSIYYSTTIESRKVARIKIVCDGCGIEAMFNPSFGKMNAVINGAISSSEPCPDCGGKMSSIKGNYTFVKGELIEPNS